MTGLVSGWLREVLADLAYTGYVRNPNNMKWPFLETAWDLVVTYSCACNPTYSLGSPYKASQGDYKYGCNSGYKYLLSPIAFK